jgi:GntR family transcriptional regulator
MTAIPTLVVVTDDPVPAFEQLRRQLTDLIASGTLAPGERLPPLRQLAGDLGLAVGTVARTYRELEAAGLIRSRRGGGTRVATTAPTLSVERRAHLLGQHASAYVQQARRLGADPADIAFAVQHALDSTPRPS